MTYDDIMPRVSCFVLAGGAGERLRPLTSTVPKPLLRFGGLYRLLDVTLSNIVNSRLRSACVLSQYRKRDIGDYLRECWGPAGDHFTRFIHQPPSTGKAYRGTADAVAQNLDILPIDSDLILVVSADHVYRMDYRPLLMFHLDHGRGVTVAASHAPAERAKEFGVMSVDSQRRILEFVEKPPEPTLWATNEAGEALVNMGIYVFDRWILQKAIADLQDLVPNLDFGRHLIPHLVAHHNAAAYAAGESIEFSYWRDVGCPASYYRSNMDLLQTVRPFDLFDSGTWPIYPIQNNALKEGVRLPRKSIIAADALLGECSIEQSIIAPGASVEDNAVVRDSILLPGARVARGAFVQNAIVDARAEIQCGDRVGFDVELDRLRFSVAEDDVVIVPVRSRETVPALPIAARSPVGSVTR